MRLATVRDGSRDGALVVVDDSARRLLPASAVARSLQQALDDWARCEPRLRELSAELARGASGLPLVPNELMAPLPRAYEWVDGSAYLNHVRLVRLARGAEPPPTLESDPLVYQGGSSDLQGATQPFSLVDEAFGLDFEAEIAVILDDTPLGTRSSRAAPHVRLLACLNDWTYRQLIPTELAKGFGFFASKPATAFAPFVVTPDELGGAWHDGRLDATMRIWLDGALVGELQTGEGMNFSFYDLIGHITRTRAFGAGTLLGSGTISNAEEARGVACLQEQRARETIAFGAPRSPFLGAGSHVRIELTLADGRAPFGVIEQEVRSS